jgi:hypothetical protein
MTASSPQPDADIGQRESRDVAYWAQYERGAALRVSGVAPEAINLNVDGRRVVGPLQGFGRLWQKTFRVRLRGVDASPTAVIRALKERLPEFQPPQNRFFPPVAGVRPGEVVLINASLTGLPVDTGVLVLYADDESFTLMTPQGHPESGWVTFSAYQEVGTTVAQIQTISRANDPVYELGFRLAGSRAQDRVWTHVLAALAAHFGVDEAVATQLVLVDRRVQWSQARNIWYNAAMRSAVYSVASPLRRLRALLGRRERQRRARRRGLDIDGSGAAGQDRDRVG